MPDFRRQGRVIRVIKIDMNTLSDRDRYAILGRRDKAYADTFFVGVKSTGIFVVQAVQRACLNLRIVSFVTALKRL